MWAARCSNFSFHIAHNSILRRAAREQPRSASVEAAATVEAAAE